VFQALFVEGLTTREAATQISGRGLGLSAVEQAIRALGGRILVESEAGRGTTFQFILPLQATDAAHPDRSTP
jgi:chemotaxis protein histidine kinase CheA